MESVNANGNTSNGNGNSEKPETELDPDQEPPKRKRRVGRPRTYSRIPLPPKPTFVRQGEEVEAALKEIKVDINKVALAPKFTDLLMMARDGLPGVLEAMRYSRNPLIEKFLRLYDRQPDKLKAILPWEAWAIKAEIPIPQLLGEIIFALREHSVNAIKILAITHHPETVWTRIQMAKTPLGVRERQALDTALGFLPTPRGPTFIGRYYESGIKPDAEIGARDATPIAPGTPPPEPSAPVVPENPPDPEEIEMDNVFPDASKTLKFLED